MTLIPKNTPIDGVWVINTSSISDERGAFTRLYCNEELGAILGNRKIVQINHSKTSSVGAIRGMHFQYAPHAEMKLIRCIKGRVWDVALDLRTESPTFLRWHAAELSEANKQMMIIPEGCAHGFQVLEPDSELLYLHTEYYYKSSEGGVRHDDPLVGIQWPLGVTDLSQRDRNHPLLHPSFPGHTLAMDSLRRES